MKATSDPSFGEALRFWFRLGLISFGGPTGQIAIMHTELVERKKWIGEERFLHALNYCMLLPGPEAQQLAIYAGWLLHGKWGGIVAGTLFVLPSALMLWALSWLYAVHGDLAWMMAIFAGLKPAVLAIVAAAVFRIGSKVLKNSAMVALAGLAFVAIFFFKVPFPLIIGVAALLGLLGERWWKSRFLVLKGHGPEDVSSPEHTRVSWARSLQILLLGICLWWTPVLLAGYWLGPSHVLVQQGVFFSQAAMVTFGGAYAVLPYVSQQAVERHGWLSPTQMLDGLGLAETTPGPLIIVLQFVGFLGGWKMHEPLSPLACATLAALMTTWTTFVPCFIWIFLGAPYIERLRGNHRLTAALSAITAAIVGVVLNLAVWLAWHVWFPQGEPTNTFGILVSAIMLYGVVRRKWEVVPVVLGAGGLGLLTWLLTQG